LLILVPNTAHGTCIAQQYWAVNPRSEPSHGPAPNAARPISSPSRDSQPAYALVHKPRAASVPER
jgi:hypothetical protein